ncbi:hypothetical protein EON65_50080 [archaeon]|nr:MAG: hypothetical protein EON65_50080 [archaeon]
MDTIDLVISQTQIAIETLQVDVDGIDMVISQTQVDPFFSSVEDTCTDQKLPSNSDNILFEEVDCGTNQQEEEGEKEETGTKDRTELGDSKPQSPLLFTMNKAESHSSSWIDAGNKNRDSGIATASIFALAAAGILSYTVIRPYLYISGSIWHHMLIEAFVLLLLRSYTYAPHVFLQYDACVLMTY